MVFRTKRAKVLASRGGGRRRGAERGTVRAERRDADGQQGRGGDHVRLDRVFIIVLENHSAKSVIGDPTRRSSRRWRSSTARPRTTSA
jgi:hypothetical protein